MLLTPKKAVPHDVAPASFPLALPVTQILLFPSGASYPIYPRCSCNLDREYRNYCHCRGHRMCWKKYSNAKILPWRKPKE